MKPRELIARTLARLSVHDVGALAGLGASTLSRYERGLREPGEDATRRICAVLGLDPDWAFQEWRPED